MWHVVEPTRELMPSVAVDAICAALQAVAEGRIKRLAIACPPGVSKSLLVAVLFPAWLMLREHGRTRAMVGSYSWDFAQRDSRRCRDLINTRAFAALVDGEWALRADADRIDDYWTTAGGRRLITSVAGKSTGERCSIQLIDDALSAADTHSRAARRESARWISEVLPSRLEDQESGARVIVGQRLHPDDPIAHVIEQGWRVLELPAVLGADAEPCELRDDAGAVVWRDPRAPGEPLVALLGSESLARLRVELGPSAYAAQYDQRPHDDTAAMFPRSCFDRRWAELPERFDQIVIALDASFKAGESSDYAVAQVWGALGRDRYLIEQWRKQAGFADTLAALQEMARRYPFAKVLVEAAANGHAIFDQLSRELAGVHDVKPDGGKVARAASVQAIVTSGVVVLPAHAPWVDAWIDEVSAFPAVKHDDQADAAVYALRELQNALSNLERWEALASSTWLPGWRSCPDPITVPPSTPPIPVL
jgi:predicted phage terminase large subunit-like protein